MAQHAAGLQKRRPKRADRVQTCSHSCAAACKMRAHLHSKVCKAHGVGVPHRNLAARLVGHMHLRGRVQKGREAGG